jgi:hypothetical protein
MSTYGDDDPEDAWDASDDVPTKLDVLRRWVPSIEAEHADGDRRRRVELRRLQALDDVERLLRLRTLSDKQRALLAALHDRLRAL